MVLGSIFDSSPGHISVENAYISVTQTSNSCIFNNLAYAFLVLLDIAFLNVEELDKNFYKRLQDPKSDYPQLYLYSSDDPLTRPEIIEDWINQEEKRVVVWKKKWEKSKHVQHFRLHKEEYSNEVLKFMKFCEENKRSRL